MLKYLPSAGIVCLLAGSVFAGEAIEGIWKSADGTLIEYSAKSDGEFCGSILNTEYQGQNVGCLTGSGRDFKGEVRTAGENKSYYGKARIDDNTLKLSSCALWGLICKSENLKRQ